MNAVKHIELLCQEDDGLCHHAAREVCENCCTHEDTPECGYCIDCGEYIGHSFEAEINNER